MTALMYFVSLHSARHPTAAPSLGKCLALLIGNDDDNDKRDTKVSPGQIRSRYGNMRRLNTGRRHSAHHKFSKWTVTDIVRFKLLRI